MVKLRVSVQWLLLGLLLTTTQGLQKSAMLEPPTVSSKCKMQVGACEPLQFGECMGAKLPYTHTSVVLANDSSTQADIHQKLAQWSGLKYVPKCWEVVQPLLCAVYMPKCNDTGNYIELPGVDVCEITRGPCKIVADTLGWPKFLTCNQTHFVKGCGASLGNLQFNTTGFCNPPLIRTENKGSWFGPAEGCGVQCDNPLFTEEEHTEMHLFIAVMGTLCMMCTLFTIVTFIIDWKNASRYPALILFFINCCFFIGSIGWMAQFFPNARQDIVCKKDGTMRRSEPQLGSGENITCTAVFVLVYYFMIAGITWFVILGYAWNLTFRAFRSTRETLEPQKAVFHIAAWSIPLVLTIICLAITQIDGDSLSGICFVGYYDHVYRGLFVLLPVGLVLVVGMIFLMLGIVTLCKLQCSSPGLLSDRASAKIRETIIRIGVFAGFSLIFVTITFVVHVYIFINERGWQDSFEQYILCEAKVEGEKLLSNETSVCVLKNKPKLLAMEIHVFAYFGAGIVMSSWVWNRSTVDAWRRFIRRLCRKPSRDPVKLKKHEVIAQAFHKRKEINTGRLSLSFASTHDDPLGMKFDVNSISSQEMTSVWASALPRLVARRGAMVYPAMMGRRHSDSDIESIKSVSSLQQKLVALQKEVSYHRNQQRRQSESHSQNSQSDKSDRSRRKKRRHRKRGRNRVIPFGSSSPSVPGTNPSQADDEHRRGSFNSNGTNPSFTNISSSVTTGNRINTSDDDRVITPDTRKIWAENVRKAPAGLPALPTGRKKAYTTAVQDDPDQVNSSDEERVTPELSRPPLPHNTEAKVEEIENIASSDEDRATPEGNRPQLILVAAAGTKDCYEEELESIHSSDEECATPELSRPSMPGIDVEKGEAKFTAIQAKTTYTMITTNSPSLLDRVIDMQSFEDSDLDTCDLEVADINLDKKNTSPQRKKKKSAEITAGNHDIPIPTKNKRHQRNNYHSNQNHRSNKQENGTNKNNKTKVKELPQAWSPESSYDHGRSRSPVMSAFKKVKDWINAPVQTPVIPITPIETPDIVDLNLSKIIQNHMKGGASPGHIVMPKARRHHRKPHRGSKNRGYDESEA